MVTNQYSGIGERIKAAREKRCVSQEQLATAVDVKRETLNHWEAETRSIKHNDLFRLCNALDVSADYLLGRMEGETHPTTIIRDHTGLSQKAADALDNSPIYGIPPLVYGDARQISDPCDAHITPAGLDALNRLLSTKDGLEVLTNIGRYLNSGLNTFANTIDGAPAVTVETVEVSNAAGKQGYRFSVDASMLKFVAQNEIIKYLERMRSRPTPERVDELQRYYNQMGGAHNG